MAGNVDVFGFYKTKNYCDSWCYKNTLLSVVTSELSPLGYFSLRWFSPNPPPHPRHPQTWCAITLLLISRLLELKEGFHHSNTQTHTHTQLQVAVATRPVCSGRLQITLHWPRLLRSTSVSATSPDTLKQNHQGLRFLSSWIGVACVRFCVLELCGWCCVLELGTLVWVWGCNFDQLVKWTGACVCVVITGGIEPRVPVVEVWYGFSCRPGVGIGGSSWGE